MIALAGLAADVEKEHLDTQYVSPERLKLLFENGGRCGSVLELDCACCAGCDLAVNDKERVPVC